MEFGEIIHAGYNLYGNILNRLFQGENLADIASDIEQYWLIGEKLQHDFLLSMLAATRFFVNSLSQPLEAPDSLITAEQAWVERSEALQSYTALGTYYILQMHRACLIQGLKPNIHYMSEAGKFLSSCAGFTNSAGYYYYSSLILCNGYPSLSETERQEALQQIATNQAQLKAWSESCSENFLHKYYLVAAERSRVTGKSLDALYLYDRAIAEAKANGYVQEEALAYELAAKFYLNWGKEKVAAGYMQDAYYCYAHWGAKAKTEDLEKRYPHLLQPILQQAAQTLNPLETLATIAAPNISIHSSTPVNHSSGSINLALDFAAILKASQAISGTIQLDDLLQKLTQIILQNSGGDRCALILPNQQGEWQVRAIATPETTELCLEALDDHPSLPVQLIHYVKNTQQVVVVHDCQTDLPVLDEYLTQHQPKSVLCLPILSQGHLLGILYLKNRFTRDVFTSDRILIVNFLCTQAAIAIENARLYQQAQDHAQQLEQSLAKLQASESRFQKLANNVPGMIYQIQIEADGTSSTPYASSGCQTLYEVAAEDLMSGKYSLRDFEHPEDKAEAFQAAAKSAQTLTPFCHEWRIITPSGKVKWVKALAQPERRENGKIIWDGMLIEITDRKHIEAEQIRLLAILENTSDFIGTAEPTGKALYMNRAWRNLMQLDDEEAVTGSDIAQSHPDWAFEIIATQALPEAIRSGMWVGETAILDSTGQEIPVSQVVLAHKSSNGEVEYFSTILRDISDIKAAEAALRASETNLRILFDSSNYAIFVHDIDGKLLDVNHRMLEMYHLNNREEALARNTLDYSAPDNPFEQVPLLWSRAVEGETVCFEWKSQRPDDGVVFDTEIILNKIMLDNQEVIIASVHDISDRKRIEAERQQAEAMMRLSEERYRSLITVSSQIVWIAAPDGLSVISPNWCNYTGQSLDKLKNFGWLEALHPDDIEFVGRVWDQAREMKSSGVTQLELERSGEPLSKREWHPARSPTLPHTN